MWVAVDKDGDEYIYEEKPIKCTSSGSWVCKNEIDCIEVPKGTIQRLLNYPLTWDDDCQEIVEYKDSDGLKEDKVIKQNIKIRVTPEQSRKVQEICFDNLVFWAGNKNTILSENQKYLYINDGHITFGATYEYFEKYDVKEIDADLFIRTNGTCEDMTLNEEYNKIEKKVFNLKKQLEKYVTKIGNQKEEISRLLNQKEELEYKLNGVTNLVELSIQNDDLWAKELKEKDAIIKYLENKLEI